jgi:PKD repeat protein
MIRRMTDQKPSTALTGRLITRRSVLTAIGVAALVAGGGVGAAALVQANQQTPTETIQVSDAQPKNLAENQAPVAVIGVNWISDTTVSVTAVGSADADGEIVSYSWDYGDSNTSTDVESTHVYAASGTYTVTLTVADDEGATASTTQAVTVTVAAPPPPPPPSTPTYTYGQYPPGAVMPKIPGTDQPDTSACASSTGTTNSNGQAVCA